MSRKPTGSVELDVIHRIAELLPGRWQIAGPLRNVWDGPEIPASGPGAPGVVREDALFVELITTRHDRNNDDDAVLREFDVTLLRRFTRSPAGDARARARDEATALYDALDCSGTFTGKQSGGEYHDIRAIDSPTFLDDRHYVFDVTVWRAG